MTYTPDDAQLITDLEQEWQALENFFRRFTTADWMRPHGKEWTFGDVPYHLMVFHNLFAEAFGKAELPSAPKIAHKDELRTQRALDRWNEERFTQRPPNQTGGQSFELLRRSVESMRTALIAPQIQSNGVPDLDRRVWLPVLRVRGYHSIRLALDYLYWHNWLHFTEASLRHNDELPPYSAEAMHRALNIHMHVAAGTVDPAQIDRSFTWHLSLVGEGGGEWTFSFKPGVGGAVVKGKQGSPDSVMEHPIADYLKLTAFNMTRPNRLSALWNTAVASQARTLVQVNKWFTGTPDAVVNPLQDAEIEPEIIAF